MPRIVVGRVAASSPTPKVAASCSMKSGFPSAVSATSAAPSSRLARREASSSEFGELAASSSPRGSRGSAVYASSPPPHSAAASRSSGRASVEEQDGQIVQARRQELDQVEEAGSAQWMSSKTSRRLARAPASTKRRTERKSVSRSGIGSPSSRGRAGSRDARRRPRPPPCRASAPRACASFSRRHSDVVAVEDAGRAA